MNFSRFHSQLLLAVSGSIAVCAQPIPKLNSASREWLQRGQKADLVFYGENLGSVTNILIDGAPGISARIARPRAGAPQVESAAGLISSITRPNGNELHLNIESDPHALLTTREIRVAGPDGVSNPLELNLSPLPLIDSARNQSRETAQKLTLPVIVSGVIQSAAQSDYFSFSAKKGQHVILEVNAYRMGSKLDSSLAVLDKSGRELARNEDAAGLDSILDFEAPADGEYVAELRDFRYQGGGDYKYQLTIGVLPHVTRFFPFGARRGQSVDLSLTGQNLESDTLLLQIDPETPEGRQEIRALTAAGLSSPFSIDVSDLPRISETEPNNAREQANPITIPAAINGRINKPKDTDVFRFHARKDQRVVFEIAAWRFGSQLDAVLTLRDAAGKVLTRNDDAAGSDARVDYTFHDDGEYQIVAEDLLNRGGDEFGYQLTAETPRPEYSLTITRDTPRLHRGGHVPVRCEISRSNGFRDPVRIACERLPAGVYAEPLVLDESASAGMLVLHALPDAVLGTFPLKIVAAAQGGGTPQEAEVLANDHAVKAAYLTVLESAPFRISPTTLMASLEQNQNASIDFIVERGERFAGDIKVFAEGFSAGREPITRSFDVPALVLKNAQRQGTLSLHGRIDSETGTRTVILRAEAEYNGGTVTDYSSLIPVRLAQIPFVLTTSLKKLIVTALPPGSGSAANEAVITVKCERRGGYEGGIDLKLEGVPDGVTATVNKIPEKAGEAVVKLVASEKAPAGKEFTLKLTGSGIQKDRTYRFSTAPVSLTINAPDKDESKQPKLANSK